MKAQAYAGDPLGAPTPDMLSVIRLNSDGLAKLAGSIPVRNSVVGPPASIGVTPDGAFAIVIETRGRHPANSPQARLKDLPPGREVSVVDLRDPTAPRVVQRFSGRPNPVSVTIQPDGRLVVIAYDTTGSPGAPLDLFDFRNGRLINARSVAVPGFATDDALKNAAFAPNGLLGLVYATKPRLSLVRIEAGGASPTITRWGNDVPLTGTPFEVRFTPDGRFALINDMFVPSTGQDVRGTVTSVAIGATPSTNGQPINGIVSTARTGVLPEGLTVSPDGRWVATTNLERTAYSAGDVRQGLFASVTLLHLDPQTGKLARVGDYPFAGVIPEAATFDNSSRYLAVISFDHLKPLASGAPSISGGSRTTSRIRRASNSRRPGTRSAYHAAPKAWRSCADPHEAPLST